MSKVIYFLLSYIAAFTLGIYVITDEHVPFYKWILIFTFGIFFFVQANKKN